MNWIALILLSLVVYFLITRVGTMYYSYWLYKNRGVAMVKFPLPLIGNILLVKEAVSKRDKFTKSLFS